MQQILRKMLSRYCIAPISLVAGPSLDLQVQLKRIVAQDLKSLISSFIFPSGNRELVTLMRNSNDVTRAGER